MLKPLIEISQFFKNLCSTTLREDILKEMHWNSAITFYKLEMTFPPSFFNVMEHLLVYVVEEAQLGGPVEYQYMYPFERYNGLYLMKPYLNSYMCNHLQVMGIVNLLGTLVD